MNGAAMISNQHLLRSIHLMEARHLDHPDEGWPEEYPALVVEAAKRSLIYDPDNPIWAKPTSTTTS